MSTKTYRLMRALVLANILSAAAVSAASATCLQRGPSVRTRKLRIPGSSSTIRIEACASALNSAPPADLPSFPAGSLTVAAALAFDVGKFMPGFVGPNVAPGNHALS